MVMNKKGSTDLMFLIIVLFTVVLSSVLVYYTYSKVNDELANLGFSGEAMEASESVKSGLGFLDYFFLMCFIGMMIVMVLLAFMIRSHPALFLIFIILMILTVVVSTSISNAWYSLSVDTELASTISTKFPISNFLMRNLPLEVAVFGIVLLIITYSKTQAGAPY